MPLQSRLKASCSSASRESVRGPKVSESKPDAVPFTTEPHESLYSCLFEGDRLRPEARERLIGYILPVMESEYPGAREWVRFTMYGSGISYNWDEKGDLDIQVWTDVGKYAGDGGVDPEGLISGLRKAVGPVNFPSMTDIGIETADCSGVMRVQYYVKEGTGSHEENLREKPYACYDLDADEWIVHPEPLTPEFYADMFLVVEARAKDLAEQAGDLLDDLERNIASAAYWKALADEGDDRYEAEANEARVAAEQAKAGVSKLFDAVYDARAEAYTDQGRGIRDERDATSKLLEVWGVLQKLKHSSHEPLPWEPA